MELETFVQELRKKFSFIIDAEVSDYSLNDDKTDGEFEVTFNFAIDDAEQLCSITSKYMDLKDYKYQRFSHTVSWMDGTSRGFLIHCIGRQEKSAYIIVVRVYRE